ncbi:MAG: hypothetical protein EPN31_00865 [Castellaniella sp.]|nr:MAG: hypothetical protein EPN31_00865 [Castellaniella sp.]
MQYWAPHRYGGWPRAAQLRSAGFGMARDRFGTPWMVNVSDCGWCKDRWGLSWQIIPADLTNTFTGPDRAAAKRVFDAMMRMQKIDVAAIEAARNG